MPEHRGPPPSLDALRAQAEARLAKQIAALPTMPAGEVRALVQELQTHQIELEIQNEELRRTQAELAASRDRFSDLYDFAPIGYATLSDKGLILEANLTLADQLQVPRGQLPRQRFASFVHPDDEDTYYRHRRDTLAGGTRRACRLQMISKGGSRFWAEIDTLPVRHPRSDEIQLRCAVSDVSQLHEVEVALQQTQRLEAIGTLAGGLAHHLNNILQVVIGNTQFAVDALPEDGAIRADLARVLQSAGRGATLIRQLLAFGRPESSDCETVDLRILIAETVQLLGGMIPPPTTVVPTIDPECGSVAGNVGELQQVIFNLCTNAHHALAGESGEIRVSLNEIAIPLPDGSVPGDLPPGRYARITVADDGQGMTAETLQRAREPFFSTRPLYEGAGLGLFTSHSIAASHGGTMQITSTVDVGTEVAVYLPRGQVETIPVQEGKAVKWKHGVKPRILFVDDEPLVTELTQRLLENKGYPVTSFLSGQEALQVFADDPAAFDLVITDQMMPDVTGIRLAERITAIRPGIPVILISGLVDGIDLPDPALTGIVQVLTKPLDSFDLERAIMDAVEARPGLDPPE